MSRRGSPQREPKLRVHLAGGRAQRTATLIADLGLATVCDAARCPNRGACFTAGTATFLILGPTCTRACRFCAVGARAARRSGDRVGAGTTRGAERATGGELGDEPSRVAAAVAALGLQHVVITSVTRDDLDDGGAAQFAATISAIRAATPDTGIEVLVPDFGGDDQALATVLAAAPDVIAHNVETVARLAPCARPQADHERSLRLLTEVVARRTHQRGRLPIVKSGAMVGLGETPAEMLGLLADLASVGVDVVTIGQYLRPADCCLPVARVAEDDEYERYRAAGARLGLTVVAGAAVRSSYRAAEVLSQVDRADRRAAPAADLADGDR